MTEDDLNKIKAVILFMLTHVKGDCNVARLYNILYVAEKKHIEKYFCRIINDTYIAEPYGPCPLLIHNILFDKRSSNKEYPLSILSNAFYIDEHFIRAIVHSKEDVDIDWLSQPDIECILEALSDTNDLHIDHIRHMVCDEAWEKALLGDGVIDNLEIARTSRLDMEEIDYIREQKKLEDYLK